MYVRIVTEDGHAFILQEENPGDLVRRMYAVTETGKPLCAALILYKDAWVGKQLPTEFGIMVRVTDVKSIEATGYTEGDKPLEYYQSIRLV